MKRIILPITVLILVLSLGSCLDAIQYVTVNNQSEIEMSFMLTISKGLFEMGGGDESVEDTFSEEVFDPDEISSMIPGARNVEARLIDSDVDYGYLFHFTLPRGYEAADDTPMVPHIGWDRMEILLAFPGDEAEADEESGEEASMQDSMDEMGEAIFSSAKYKVQISKRLLENAERAYVRESSGEITDLDLVDLGDNYLVNLPMLMVMMSEEETWLVFEY